MSDTAPDAAPTTAAADGGQPQSARVVIEVTAGLVPGYPDAEHTRRWTITDRDWEAAAANRGELLAHRNGAAQGYAALMMLQPDRVNWVRTEWIYL